MALRIAIDCRHIKDFGVGTYIRNITRALARIDQQNQYTLVAARADLHQFGNFPPNFRPLAYDRRDSEWRDQIAFPLFLRRLTTHLFHMPLHTVPWAMPRPYIVTIHDLSSLLFDRPDGWRGQIHLQRVKRGLLAAERVIAVSSATRRDVVELLQVPAECIRVIYNAPDPRFLEQVPAADARLAGPEAIQKDQERILERYQIKYPFILYVGNIRPQKNVPRLIEAFAVLHGELADHPQYSSLRLIIIGDEISKYPSVRRAVAQSRMIDVVRFLGFVPIDTLRVFYRAAAAFAFPSLYEGFGLPPLEAMAAGTPVVASGVSSLPEVLGDAAVIVNPENVFDIARGLRDALLDQELRAELVARGYRQVQRFNWERTASEVLQLYREVSRALGVS